MGDRVERISRVESIAILAVEFSGKLKSRGLLFNGDTWVFMEEM